MRYLIYLLIIANLAFWAWYPRPPEPGSLFSPAAWPLPPEVESLVLLSERPDSAQDEPVKAEPVPEPGRAPELAVAEPRPEPKKDEPVEPPPPLCHTIGPFLSKETRSAVSRELRKAGLEPKQRTSEVQEQIGYWVYLPGMSSTEAKRVAQELTERGVSDYFIGKQNYISLGAFSDKNTAEARRRRIEGMGYNPRLDPRFRTRTVYWLDVMEDGTRPLPGETWSGIRERHPEARRQSLSCE